MESIPLHDSHSHTESGSILDDLPASLRTEIENYAAKDNMPPEFVVELAISFAGAVGNRSLSRSRLNDIQRLPNRIATRSIRTAEIKETPAINNGSLAREANRVQGAIAQRALFA